MRVYILELYSFIMRKILNRIKRLFRKSNFDPFKELEDKGLKIAESTKKSMHSPQGIDALFPWLIEIGEKCKISTQVCILAHDASTSSHAGMLKIGMVKIGNNVLSDTKQPFYVVLQLVIM